MIGLNLGCGEEHLTGYVNVDLQGCGDVQADVRSLPWASGSVDEIRAFDLLEHFWRDEVDRVLDEWLRVLTPGGRVSFRVPNLTVLGRMLSDDYDTAKIVENVYGGHRYGPEGAWDTHHWGWTRPGFGRWLMWHGIANVVVDKEPNMTAIGFVP